MIDSITINISKACYFISAEIGIPEELNVRESEELLVDHQEVLLESSRDCFLELEPIDAQGVAIERLALQRDVQHQEIVDFASEDSEALCTLHGSKLDRIGVWADIAVGVSQWRSSSTREHSQSSLTGSQQDQLSDSGLSTFDRIGRKLKRGIEATKESIDSVLKSDKPITRMAEKLGDFLQQLPVGGAIGLVLHKVGEYVSQVAHHLDSIAERFVEKANLRRAAKKESEREALLLYKKHMAFTGVPGLESKPLPRVKSLLANDEHHFEPKRDDVEQELEERHDSELQFMISAIEADLSAREDRQRALKLPDIYQALQMVSSMPLSYS